MPRDPQRVICLGQIFPEKRVAEMIGIVERARALSGRELTFRVGGPLADTPYVRKIRALAAERPWVELSGGVYGDDKSAFLQGASFALHAERDEAFGIVVTEFLKTGVVPVVPDEGGAPEVAGNPALAYHDDEQAARILARLAADEAFRDDCRRKCAERAGEFSRERYLEKQNRLLNEIVDAAEREAKS